MEKRWDTVIPADLKRLFISGIYYVPLVTKGLKGKKFFLRSHQSLAGQEIAQPLYNKQRLFILSTETKPLFTPS